MVLRSSPALLFTHKKTQHGLASSRNQNENKNKQKNPFRGRYLREEEGRKGEERCLFPTARIPLWLLRPCQHPHHSSQGLPPWSCCETPLPTSHFISGLCGRDLGSAALLVFLRHLLPFLFGKPVTFTEGLILSPQSLGQIPAFAICALEAPKCLCPFS